MPLPASSCPPRGRVSRAGPPARQPPVSDTDTLPPLGEDFGRILDEALGAFELELTPGMRAGIEAHARLLLAWNASVNLTAVRSAAGIALEHVADSLSAVPFLLAHFGPRRAHGRPLEILDLGSGAGYPGLPAAIAVPATSAVLLDSIAKKTAFLTAAAVAVRKAMEEAGEEAPRLMARTGRAEDLARAGDRDHWEVVTARAIAPMPRLMELGLPLVRPGGVLLAWKRESGSGGLNVELAEAQAFLEPLGAGPAFEVLHVPLPNLDDHRLVVARKRRATPERFPRRLPGKRPLLT